MGEYNNITRKRIFLICLIVCIFLSGNFLIVTGSYVNNITCEEIIEPPSMKFLAQSTIGGGASRAVDRSSDIDNWTMLHGNNLNHGYSNANVPRVDNVIWNTKFLDATSNPAPIISSPAVLGEQVFIGVTNHKLYSLDKLTGNINWQVNTDDMPGSMAGDAIDSSPTIVGDRLYIGCDDKHIYCFDATPDDNGDGTIDGSDTDEGLANPAGAQYDLIWYNKTNGYIKSSPKVSGDTVIIGCFNNDPDRATLYAFDATVGVLRWNYSAPPQTDFYSTPAIENDIVYVGLEILTGAGHSTIYAFDLYGFTNGNQGWTGESATGNKDGDILWNFSTDSGVDSSICIAGNKVLFATIDSNGTVYALNKQTGAELWNQTTDGPVFSSPAVDLKNNVAFIGSDVGPTNGILTALNLTNGNKFWTYSVGGGITSTPVIAKDIVMFGSIDQYLYALNATTENIPSATRFLWKYGTGGSVYSTVAPVEGMVFVGSESGYIFAFANPDLAVDFTSMKVSERFPYQGETLDISARVYNNGSIKMGANANFYLKVTYTKSRKRSVDERLISSHPVLLDVDEEIIVHTQGTIFDFNWSLADTTSFLIKLEDMTFPEKDDNKYKFNNVATRFITVLERFNDGWMSYQKNNYNTGTGDFGAKTNKTIWEFDPGFGGTQPIKSSLLHSKGSIYLSLPTGQLFSIMDSSGNRDWEFDSKSAIIGTPTILMNKAGQTEYEKIIFGTENGKVYAVNTNRGKLNWTFDTNGETIQGAPVVDEGIVYIGTLSGKLYALDEDGFFDGDQGIDDTDESLTNGDVLWSIMLAGSGAIKSSPAIFDELLIVTTSSGPNDGQVFAIEHKTHTVNWSYQFDSAIDGSVIIDTKNDRLFLGCNDQKIYTMDFSGLWDGNQGVLTETSGNNNNADILWVYNTGSTIPAAGALDVNNNILVTGTTNGNVVALNSLNGEMLWTFQTGGLIRAPPTIADEYVYITSEDGYLYCLDEFKSDASSTNTTLVWRYDTSSTIHSPAISYSYGTYIVSDNGIVYKLGAPNDAPVAKINEPRKNQTYFWEEEIILNATDSYDPEGDLNLTYIWKYITPNVNLNPIEFYRGNEPVINATLPVGNHTVILQVLDGLRKPSIENSTDIFVFAPVIKIFENQLIPATCKIYYDGAGGIDLEKTNDPGAGTPENPSGKSVGGINRFVYLFYSIFRPNYKVGWYNVSIGYSLTDLPEGYNQSRIRMFRRVGTTWVKCEDTGIDLDNKLVWANLSGDKLKPQINQLFAPGTFDNRPPTLELIDGGVSPVNGTRATTFEYRIKFTDSDNDKPTLEYGGYIIIEINGVQHYMIDSDKNNTDSTIGKFYNFLILGNDLKPGLNNTFKILVHDGTYLTTSEQIIGPDVFFGAMPVADAGDDITVEKGEVFSLDATNSYDTDGNIVKYLWDTDNDGDFNDVDGSKEGITTTWRFDDVGTYIITLLIEDDNGNTDNDTVTVTVTEPSKDDGVDIDENLMLLYAAILGIVVLLILIIFLLLVRRKMQTERDRRIFMKEGEEELEEEEEEDEEEEEEGEEEEEEAEEEEEEEELEEEEEEDEEGAEEEEEGEEPEEEEDIEKELEEELEEFEEAEEELEEEDIEKELGEELEELEEEKEPEELEAEQEEPTESAEPEEEIMETEEEPELKEEPKPKKKEVPEKTKKKVRKVKGPVKVKSVKAPKKLKKKLK